MNASPIGSATTSAGSVSVLDSVQSDEFLMIMAAELANQDPLEPMSQTEYLAQLGQLRAAAASIQTEQSVAALGQIEQIGQALSLLGQTVWWTDPETGEMMHGEVTRVEPAFPPALFVGDARFGLESVLAVGAEAPGNAP